MTIGKLAVLASTVLALALCSPSSQADDKKFYSVGGCNPYTTGTPNYNLLRFRPESVQNQSNGYLYVICPIIRDTESSWGYTATHKASVRVFFRTNSAGTFQCTLNVGSNRESLWTSTKSISGNPGDLLSVNWSSDETAASTALDAPAALVCRIPPKGSIVAYEVFESGVTDDVSL